MRVGALAWSSSLLSSGSRDKSILHHDIRAQEDYVSKLTGHKSEVMYPCFLFFLENAQESCAPLYIKKIGKRSKIDQTTAGLLTGARK
jgi:hypothetical protein